MAEPVYTEFTEALVKVWYDESFPPLYYWTAVDGEAMSEDSFGTIDAALRDARTKLKGA